MKRLPALLLLVPAAGCGGGVDGRASSTAAVADGADQRPSVGGKELGPTTNCLIDEGHGFQGAQNVGVTATTAVRGSETNTIEHCLAAARR